MDGAALPPTTLSTTKRIACGRRNPQNTKSSIKKNDSAKRTLSPFAILQRRENGVILDSVGMFRLLQHFLR
jgi:hypothetical protein